MTGPRRCCVDLSVSFSLFLFTCVCRCVWCGVVCACMCVHACGPMLLSAFKAPRESPPTGPDRPLPDSSLQARLPEIKKFDQTIYLYKVNFSNFFANIIRSILFAAPAKILSVFCVHVYFLLILIPPSTNPLVNPLRVYRLRFG